jgi:hypothetical protein
MQIYVRQIYVRFLLVYKFLAKNKTYMPGQLRVSRRNIVMNWSLPCGCI